MTQGFFKDQFRTARGSNSMASAERERAYNGAGSGLGAEPPAGVQRAEPRSEVECLFCFSVSKGSCKFAQLLIFAKVSKSHSE